MVSATTMQGTCAVSKTVLLHKFYQKIQNHISQAALDIRENCAVFER